MSTGISISSINRIKELAEEKRFAEALEILDTQNLDKSINPQFLRISGEIFRENKRYYDSRRILLKAHQMSPQGIRIIFELIQLYLELGYYTKAKKYYEQYKFYSTPEDTQIDYVEYMMKKAEGADAKELSVMLIPILERMPEDRWNFEAVLLYDKLERKDKALEECKYILENFKNSVYVDGIVKYIDNELDVDGCLYVYPSEEQEEDIEVYGDLIAEEDKSLEADYLRMYPPEARIMVDVEDKEGTDPPSAKEKKSRKKKKKKIIEPEAVEAEVPATSPEEEAAKEQERIESEKKAKEAFLEQILSKKLDKDKIKESVKQVAQAVKDIDTAKAKSQAKTVAESVKDNVKKATDVLGEAVGTKSVADENVKSQEGNVLEFTDGEIVDAIIEEVIEEPKTVVGQVITNEELDALIPDSLEAMSAEEIADIEAKREEAEHRELEVLEAELKLKEVQLSEDGMSASEECLTIEDGEPLNEEEMLSEETPITENQSTFEELKAKFLEMSNEPEEEQPLESLGFISVVQSDVDKEMEENIPDAANILHQMIDNKEFYSGEDSNRFESKESYEDHGFEVEDFDFDSYLVRVNEMPNEEEEDLTEDNEELLSVEEIYTEESIVEFEEILPENETMDDSVFEEVELPNREALRVQILLSDSMVSKLMDLKESR